MKCFNNLRLIFCQKNKDRDLSIVACIDESSFILIVQELVDDSKKESNIAVKEKYTKSACMGVYWSI